MAAPISTALPTAPATSDSPDVFEEKSFAFVGALEPFRVDLQAQADFVNDNVGPGSNAETVANIASDVSAVAAVAPDVSLLAVGQVSKTELAALQSSTLAEAVANTDLQVGQAIAISDRGYGVFDVVLASGVTPNTYNIVQCTGVATLALVLRPSPNYTARQLGATGDGVTDDSSALNNAFILCEGKTLIIESGTYELSSSRLDVNNPITVVCEQGVTFNKSISEGMLRLDDTSDVTWHGNKCMFKHTRASAGTNTFYIRGSERVLIEGVMFKDSPKDQIYIGNSINYPGTTNKDITVRGCEFDGARRQGISVIVGERLTLDDNVFHDISGEAPQAGIDLETGSNEAALGMFVSDVTITNNKFYDITVQSGLYIATASNVTVQGNNFENCLVGINATGVFANTTEKTISAVDHTTEQFTVTAHGMNVGDLLFITNTDQGSGSGTYPTGVVAKSTYRVNTVVDANTITLSSYYQAVPVSITDNGALPLQVRAYREDRLNNITIQGNTFKDMINQSVVADQCNSMVIQGNIVDGGNAGTASMLLSWCDDIIVDSNIITNTTDGEGIFCSGIRATISNNLIKGTPDQGIRFYGGEASKIINNTLIDCGVDATQCMDIRYFNNGHISGNRVWSETVTPPSIAIDMNSTDCIGNVISDNNLKGSCASNDNSLYLLDRANTISSTNILNDGTTYSAHLRTSSGNLENAANEVNTGDKYEGKMIFNSTTNVPVFASGSAPGDTWVFAAGGTAHTPV